MEGRVVSDGAELKQESLWCSCGSLLVNRHGRCAGCERRRRLSLERFGGLREAALLRDRYRCRHCRTRDDLLVHHRRPGVNVLRLLITLCRRCHSRVHNTLRPQYEFPALLLTLWRESHPGVAEQQVFPWDDIAEVRDFAAQLTLFAIHLESASVVRQAEVDCA